MCECMHTCFHHASMYLSEFLNGVLLSLSLHFSTSGLGIALFPIYCAIGCGRVRAKIFIICCIICSLWKYGERCGVLLIRSRAPHSDEQAFWLRGLHRAGDIQHGRKPFVRKYTSRASGVHDVFCDKISDILLQSSNVSASGQFSVPLFLDLYLGGAPVESLWAIFSSPIRISSWMIAMITFCSPKNVWLSEVIQSLKKLFLEL